MAQPSTIFSNHDDTGMFERYDYFRSTVVRSCAPFSSDRSKSTVLVALAKSYKNVERKWRIGHEQRAGPPWYVRSKR